MRPLFEVLPPGTESRAWIVWRPGCPSALDSTTTDRVLVVFIPVGRPIWCWRWVIETDRHEWGFEQQMLAIRFRFRAKWPWLRIRWSRGARRVETTERPPSPLGA